MRGLMRWLMGAVCAALVLAAGSVLVKGPEDAAGECLPADHPAPALAQSAAAAADEAVPVLRSERHEERAAASRTDDTAYSTVCALVCDGNRQPVTARTWVRTMYSVCPPEGMFG